MSKERAIEMRRQGMSLAQIAAALGRTSAGGSLSRWHKDVPPPEWTKRPTAKDDLRAEAVAPALKVSKSSLSLWLRDVVVGPKPLNV